MARAEALAAAPGRAPGGVPVAASAIPAGRPPAPFDAWAHGLKDRARLKTVAGHGIARSDPAARFGVVARAAAGSRPRQTTVRNGASPGGRRVRPPVPSALDAVRAPHRMPSCQGATPTPRPRRAN